MKYIVEIDETYRINGERTFKEFEVESDAINCYTEQRRGMVNILVVDDSCSTYLLQDKDGRKYIKGSPFYGFPHVPHISKIDGKEIPST